MGHRENARTARARAIALGASLLAAASCGAGEAAPPAVPGQERAAELAPRPTRGRVLGGQRVERVAEWPTPAELDPRTSARARARWGDALAESPAPILLPPASSPWLDGDLMIGPRWWAYSAEVEGEQIVVQASVSAHVYPELAPHLRRARPTGRVRGLPATFTRSEGIWSVSWIERGVAFTAELQCGGPAVPACAGGEERLRDLVDGLVWVTAREVAP